MNDKELSALKALVEATGASPVDILIRISRLEQAEAASTERANNAIDQTILAMRANAATSTDADLERRHQEATDKLFGATSTKPADSEWEFGRKLGDGATNDIDALARQQAPVGDSVDTPEFRNLAEFWAGQLHSHFTVVRRGSDAAFLALIAHITAWKDAQIARQREVAQSWIIHDPKDVIAALREATQKLIDTAVDYIKHADDSLALAATAADRALADCVGIEDAIVPVASPAPTDLSKRLRGYVAGSVVTLLATDLHAAADEIERLHGGMLAWKRTAEAKDAPQAQGEPVAMNDDERTMVTEAIRILETGFMPNAAAIIRRIVFGPAPQADEVRDAARYRWLRGSATDISNVIDKEFEPGKWEYRAGEELDAAIDAAMRTTEGKERQ